MKSLKTFSDHELSHLTPKAAELADAPNEWMQAAVGLWPKAHSVPIGAVARAALRRVVAALSFDSWAPTPMAMGLRAALSDTRHLLFTAEGRDVDLRISPVAEHFALTGQILGPDESGVIELVAEAGGQTPGAVPQVTTLDELGEFRIDGVRRGNYRLTLRVGNDEIVLPPIEVGAA